jgi:quinolinate synthase
MIRRPAESVNREFIVATETGILHRLRRANPDKTFFAASDRAECQYMKLTTRPKVLNSLERMQYRITVPADVAAKARLALERMVAVGGSTSGPPLVGVAGFDPGE